MESSVTSLFHSIGTARDEVEAAIRRQVDTIRDSDTPALEGIAAGITLPLTGAAAVLLGLAQVTVASTDQEQWDRLFSKDTLVTPDEVTP